MWDAILTEMEFVFWNFIDHQTILNLFLFNTILEQNTLLCDHTGSESNENGCAFCKKLFNKDETLLQGPSCNIWFQNVLINF